MFWLIKQIFIALLSLNDESCMIRPTLIDFNPVELN